MTVASLPILRRWPRLAAPAVLMVVVVTTVVVGVLFLLGGRWFLVETPSMGEAAPVGTLVLTEPVRLEQVQVGQIVAFRPPGDPGRVYTHRVVAIQDGALSTRGDINGAVDAWRLHQGDLVGRAVVLLPAVGFLVRAVPVLLLGNAVVHLLTGRVRSLPQRAALRNIGFSAVAALPSLLLQPFVRIQVLATEATGDRITASVVSTGLLPVRVSASTGGSTALHDGQVGTIALPTAPGGYHLHADLDLLPHQWALLLTICLLPLIWSLVRGLPDAVDLHQPDPLDGAEVPPSRVPAAADR